MSRSNTTNRSRQNADYAVYRPWRLSTFLSYACLHLNLWLAFIGSRYKIVFNISESLLFITKPEVIGSLHRKFPTQFFLPVYWIKSYILRFCSRWINNKLRYIEHNFVTWAKKCESKLKAQPGTRKKRTQSAWSAFWRDWHAVFERDMYCKRYWVGTKSPQTNKIKSFLKCKGTRL